MSKHMNLNDRNQIALGISNGKSFGEIGRCIGKSETTIAREIKGHKIVSSKGAYGRITNRCAHRTTCDISGLCEQKPDCTRRCATCISCNNICKRFEEEKCPRLLRPPYVCNGCKDKPKCVLKKWVYDPRYADEEYRSVLSEARQGFNLTEDELRIIDQSVSPLVKQGQSIHHVCVHNRDAIYVSERTIERLVDKGAIQARNIDRQRVCKLKLRHHAKGRAKIEKDCRKDRTIGDFRRFCENNPGLPTAQMDSVEGHVGGKVLLTLIFPKSELMLASLRDHNTAKTVIDSIAKLYEGLGHDDFCKLFPVILTDNGSEFSHPSALEFAPDGRRRTQIFYCDPMASYQKPQVERNHEFIRTVLPKGTSFDSLSQMDIDLMMAHVNSYGRPALGDKSPFEMFAFLYGKKLLDKLLRLTCQRVIPANEIILKPALLRR